ncbi:MAG: S8 family serine peptidase [Pseudomonadota bacterium]
MYEFKYGGKSGRKQQLALSDELVVVGGSRNRAPLRAARERSRAILEGLTPVADFRDATVSVFRVNETLSATSKRDVLTDFKADNSFAFAGNCLTEPNTGQPVVYTERVFIQFQPGTRESAINRILRQKRFVGVRTLRYADNAYVLQGRKGLGRDIFGLTMDLLEKNGDIRLCHPELLRPRHNKVAFPLQWHLRETSYNGQLINEHANVEAAWEQSTGVGTTIAVIDDGVDIDHVEFRARGGIVAPRDMGSRSNNPRPRFALDNHGTACAGVACASGVDGASGVAPDAALMPIRLLADLGSQEEADAFVFAAQQGADVISCSWGPRDGDWTNPNDPLHTTPAPLPDSTRLALQFAAERGRNGDGCVICWAAGNGNESVDLDGYASSEFVMAVGASNDRGTRSAYSDFGDALWCMFPSSDARSRQLTNGIWTTDRIGGLGYNPGDPQLGHPAGDYTNDFGGTSSACPGVAGLAALMLAREPRLGLGDIWDIIRETSQKIDVANGNYDAETGHSRQYGYGRVDCAAAVAAASLD